MRKADTMSRQIWNSITEIPEKDWESVHQGRNIYLSIPYLTALEGHMKDSMRFVYSISYSTSGEPILIAAFQLVQFIDKRRQYSEALCHLSYHVHKKIADAFTINVLVAGNVFADGENGFLWSEELDAASAMDEMEACITQLKENPEIKELASITLFKEFWPESTPFSERLRFFSYRSFMIDVNMVLKIQPEWKEIANYLDSMKTKFRTRAKSVYKKSEVLQIRSLGAGEILAEVERIQELFDSVLKKSDFSFGKMDVRCFAEFASSLGSDFSFRGFYLDGKLLGFSTGFMNGQNFEANYVGLDYEYNTDLCIYQRILYDYVEQALARNAQELQLGRTAEQIKSTIGAIPMNMKLYAKHRSSVPNLLLKPIVRSIAPSEFELRQPFKTIVVS